MRPGRVLAGRACSRAIHVDMSEYLHGILEVNAEERWARVQPGVVLDELNAHLGPCVGPHVRAGRARDQPGQRRGGIGNDWTGTCSSPKDRAIAQGRPSSKLFAGSNIFSQEFSSV